MQKRKYKFTTDSKYCSGPLKINGIRIRMDGKACWRDNVFVEQLYRTIKYEELYL